MFAILRGGRPAVARIVSIFLLFGGTAGVHAQVPTNAFVDYEKRIRAAEMVSPLRGDLFGDSVSLYNGATEFVATDVSVPGNNELPVRLGRRFKVDVKTSGTLTPRGASSDITPLGGFGGWDIDVPYVYGMFDGAYGWRVGGNASVARCSGIYTPRVTSPFEINDIWSGYYLRLPGEGDQELTLLGEANQTPTDGHTYRWGTRGLYRGRCTTTVDNYPGEGFVLVGPNGFTYTFSHAIFRNGGVIEKANVAVGRQQIFLMVTKIADRHGNEVNYQYTGDRLDSISASDGRRIDLYWAGGTVSRVVAHGQEWRYFSENGTMVVELPDRSRWTYRSTGNLAVWPSPPLDDGGTCVESLPGQTEPFSLDITHPSGARGHFEFAYTRHGRSGTPASACTVDSIDPWGEGGSTVHRSLKIPYYSYSYSLLLKQITGPGIPALKWTYEWEDPESGPESFGGTYCGFCDPDMKTIVHEPDGTTREHIFGALWNLNEGRPLAVHTFDKAGVLVRSETYDYVSEQEVNNGVPFPPMFGEVTASDSASGLYNRPIKQTTIVQDSTATHSRVDRFDNLARPAQTTRFNSQFTRTEATEYEDNLGKWVLGQIKRVTDLPSGQVVSQVEYDPVLALPLRTYSFGKRQTEYRYNPDGTLSSSIDGRMLVTTFAEWKRGIPQLIRYHDQTTRRAAVDDAGRITSVTGEVHNTTCYEYDAMGRVSGITQASESKLDTCEGISPDAPNAWAKSIIRFEPVAASEYGIPAGHWRETRSTGNARRETYYDAFWRPLLVREYDSADLTGTQRFTRFAYDSDGRVTFVAYPANTANATTGTWTEYDALGRVTSVSQDSEMIDGRSMLVTRIEYLPGFVRRTTNPRKQVTTERFQVFDVPSYDVPVQIDLPEGARTTIARDVFGKPLSITRGPGS